MVDVGNDTKVSKVFHSRIIAYLLLRGKVSLGHGILVYMLTPERQAKLEKVAAQRRTDITVVLEDISDPHNAQAIFRTCEAFGVHHVHLISDKQAPFHEKDMGKHSSSSANKWLKVTWHYGTEACLESLKASGFTLIGTALSDTAESLESMAFPEENIALIFGNEHRGMSEVAMGLCDRLAMFEMKGIIQSLNISVCTAISLYALTQSKTNTTPPDSSALLTELTAFSKFKPALQTKKVR